MGKERKEYREDRVESYGYTSHTSESSGTSGSSESSSSDSESGGSSTERKRKHIRKKSKYKREKKKRSESEEEVEFIEREKRKRRKHAKHKDIDEVSEDDEYIRVEERKHRTRKHKHHHRKHKHKHRRHRHHRTEEEYQEKRRGGSVERGEGRKEREEWDERKYMFDKTDKDRRSDKEGDRKIRKDEKRSKEKGDSRQVKSKWDDDEDVQYNSNKRIKPDPDADETQDPPRVRQERERNRKRREREGATENGRWGTSEDVAQTVKDENNTPVNDDIQKPSMALSGKLMEDTNTFNGVVIKYSQPPEARKPKRRWRWYIFKGEDDLPFLPLHRQSAYLIGRDRKVADIPTDHPSCSKQHAVLQYRLVTYEREDGTKGRTVKPYILDLESANGTYVNNRRVDSRRFVELIEKDVVKFGYSSREYILLHEGSKGEDADVPDMGVDLSPVSLLRN